MTTTSESTGQALSLEELLLNDIMGEDGDGSELMPAPDDDGFDVRLFMAAKRLTFELREAAERRAALAADIERQAKKLLDPFDFEIERLEGKQRELHHLITGLVVENRKTTKRSTITIPGVGKASIKKVPESYRIDEPQLTWEWLKARGMHVPYAKEMELSKSAVKPALVQLMKDHAVKELPGVVHTEAHDSNLTFTALA